jgi:hypothetical protein
MTRVIRNPGESVIAEADLDLIRSVSRSRNHARGIVQALMDDPLVWRYLERKGHADALELWFDDHDTNVEASWIFATGDDYESPMDVPDL